ncbi:hypothetical protein ACGFYQ_34275 [Streptomyces sp. NPDC048258]|uniref:hypothetical protein n=1 Tax=Streptomyces sp. NPDC048258 TaxID=3365527 RepID=UPI0037147DA4
MVNFLDTQTDSRRMAALLADYDRRLQALERTTQASHSSIEGGAINIYDKDGQHRGSVGVQPDGAVAIVPKNSPPPPTPTQPTITPVLAGLLVAWDGLWEDSYTTPSDFSLVQIHVGPAADFTPSAATLTATITDPLGGALTIAVAGYAPVWVRLVAANTAAITGPVSKAIQGTPRQAVPQDLIDGIVTETKLAQSAVTAAKIALGAVNSVKIADDAITAPKILAGAVTTDKLLALAVTAEKIASLAITTDKLSALSVTADKLAVNSVTATKIEAGAIEAGHIKAGTITADKLALGTDGNLVADPSFEGPVTDQRLTGLTYWTAVTPGNGTPRAIQVDATAVTATTRTHVLALAPAVPGQRVFLAVDYLASTDWAGSRVSIYVRWEDSAGALLGYSIVTTGDGNVQRGSWQRIQGVPAEAAPPNTVRARVTISTNSSTAGTVRYDNAQARHILSSGSAGGRAELSPLGLLLYDGDGEESVSLVTGRPNYLTFSNNGQAVATIDQHGNAGFGNLAVAESLTVGGDPIKSLLSDAARGLVAIGYQTSAVTAGSTDFGFVELSFNADASRMYRVVLDCYANPSAVGGELILFLRDAGPGTPTINSPQIQSAIHPLPTEGMQRVRLETIRSGEAFGAGQHRLLTTFYCSGGPSGQNVMLFGGGNHPGVFYVEDVGPAIPDTGQYNTGGGSTTPPVQRYSKTYDAAWSGSYANRGAYNSYYGNQMMCGYYSSTNGLQASLVGFPAQLGADLAGATIESAEIYLYFDHWYFNAGGTAVIRAHGHGSRPGSFSCDSESQSVSWSRNEGKWVDITAVFDSTAWRGIALDPNDTSSTYYGSARGVGEDYPPQLRVTYTK